MEIHILNIKSDTKVTRIDLKRIKNELKRIKSGADPDCITKLVINKLVDHLGVFSPG